VKRANLGGVRASVKDALLIAGGIAREGGGCGGDRGGFAERRSPQCAEVIGGFAEGIERSEVRRVVSDRAGRGRRRRRALATHCVWGLSSQTVILLVEPLQGSSARNPPCA
jgi:hypothetical protein